jgi:hypothetical protein
MCSLAWHRAIVFHPNTHCGQEGGTRRRILVLYGIANAGSTLTSFIAMLVLAIKVPNMEFIFG